MVKTNSNKGVETAQFEIQVIDMPTATKEAIDENKWISGVDLAEAVAIFRDAPLPGDLNDYLSRYLKGKIAKPKGRRPMLVREMRRRDMNVRGLYRAYYTYLKDGKDPDGIVCGDPWVEEAKTWDGPPSERAARLVAELFPDWNISARHVLNLVSSGE